MLCYNRIIKNREQIREGGNKMYRLGWYDENGEQECLSTVKTKEEAKECYNRLHEKYGCTIWIQKVEFVKPEELFS